MIAVDTNVLVRLVTNDDPKQSPRAAQLFARNDVYISKTVLLETEWVLRGAYELSTEAIGSAFARLVEIPSVTLEDAPRVARALGWYAAGLDFADALHLASSTVATGFTTFDRAFGKRAASLSATPAVAIL